MHQMRVTTRRLRSALATFRPLFERTTTEPIREELKWLGAVLGRARDAEVLGERLTSAAATLPSVLTLGPVSGRIGFEMRERHQDALVEVRACLSARRYFDLLDSLDQLVLQPPLTGRARRRASREVPPLVERSVHRVKRRIAAANRESDGDGRDVALFTTFARQPSGRGMPRKRWNRSLADQDGASPPGWRTCRTYSVNTRTAWAHVRFCASWRW